MDSTNHIALRRLNPTMNGMHTDRHHVGLSFCVKALSKGRYGSSLISMDVRLVNISRAIPDCFYPDGTGSSARNQSRPDAVFVRSIPGQPSYIDPTQILPQEDIHLVGFKFFPDTNPFPTLEHATAQHTNTITRLKTCSLRNPNRDNKGMHFIFRGFLGAGLLGAWQWGAGEGESRRPGAWRTSLQIPISSVSGFLLG
eukprot:1148559-Pelagomonas_calceolata.AAC.1